MKIQLINKKILLGIGDWGLGIGPNPHDILEIIS